ncbi:MAG TPA: hypothetical protein VIK55_20940 [Paludibacter sp.]
MGLKTEDVFKLEKLGLWTELNIPEAKINRGSGIYNCTFTVKDLGSNE